MEPSGSDSGSKASSNNQTNSAASSSSTNDTNPPKKFKYDDNQVRVVFYSHSPTDNNAEDQHVLEERIIQEYGANDVVKSPSYPTTSSSGGSQRTPSPNFAPNASHTSSPLPVAQQPPAQSNSHVQKPTPEEHNYAVSSTSSGSTQTAPPNENRLMPSRAASDSGNSTMSDEISPLCMTDWYRDLMKPQYALKMNIQLEIITNRSDFVKNKILTAKIAELPENLDYYPNKSRLRKQYDDPEEAAERERNNLASRRSRFKKKRAQLILNMHLEYDRNENAHLYAMQNWIGKIIFQLESQWLERGATAEQLCQLRRDCGFPQTSPGAFRLI